MPTNGFSENSLIHPQIHQLLRGGQLYQDYLENQETWRYIDAENFCFKWEDIRTLFHPPIFTDDSPPEFTHESCIDYVSTLRPVWQASFRAAHILQHDKRDLLRESLRWTGNVEVIDEFLATADPDTFVIEDCLLLTAVIENACGNIYFTFTKRNPPQLLSELLTSPELIQVLGPFPVFFLRLLIGSPKAINLRHILWHGFPTTADIPAYYMSTLLILCVTFNEMLKEKHFNIRFRERFAPKTYVVKVQQGWQCEVPMENEYVYQSQFILRSHEIYWKTLYKYFREKKYKNFVVLIIPQIELLLKLIYASCNEYEVSAKLDEYHIVMETMFRQDLPGTRRENQIFSFVNYGMLKMIYDLFISTNGPRIRDKVSHGEINFKEIDEGLALVLLRLSLGLLNESGRQTNSIFSAYESKFHLKCILIEHMHKTKDSMNRLTLLQLPGDDLQQYADWNDCELEPDHLHYIADIHLFSHPKDETEMVQLLIQISHSMKLASNNLYEFLDLRFSQNARSRNGKALEELAQNLTFLYQTMVLMNRTTQVLFITLHMIGCELQREDMISSVRFLRVFLKTAQSLIKLFSKSKNDWKKAIKTLVVFREKLRVFSLLHI